MNVKNILLVASLCLLQACTNTTKQSLQPWDVPTLYGAPIAQQASVQLAAATQAQLDEAVAEVESELESELEAAAGDLQPAHIGEVELSNDSTNVTVDAMPTDLAELAVLAPEKRAHSCAAIADEISAIDAGLGRAAKDLPPVTPPTTPQRIGRNFYDMGLQTLLGPAQIFIQTKRAIFNDAEKERRGTEAYERGATRRAYLIGYAEAARCNAADIPGLSTQADSGA